LSIRSLACTCASGSLDRYTDFANPALPEAALLAVIGFFGVTDFSLALAGAALDRL
jgi:hypothetical protein